MNMDEDYALLIRKWSPQEKALVIELREKGLGPLAISKKTGFPINQIKFWIYGSRVKNKKKKIHGKNHNLNSLKHYYRLKFNNWYHWKACTVRSSLIKRDKQHKHLVPTIETLMQWLFVNKVCVYCNIELTEKTFGVDHSLPLSRGGNSDLTNLVSCCKNCNLVKGAMTKEEYVLLLKLFDLFEDKGMSVKARLKRGHFC